MKTQRLSHALANLNDRYISEAIEYTTPVSKRHPFRMASLAACLVLILALGLWQLRPQSQVITLASGDTLCFAPASSLSSQDLALSVRSRELSSAELELLFPGLSASAIGIWNQEDLSLLGFEGNIGTVNFTISTTNAILQDTFIEGHETTSYVNGVAIQAGYYRSRANSHGIRTMIYYATFMLDGQTFYIECAGEESTQETLRIDLTQVLCQLIENGPLPDVDF